jgi:Fur family ferric uptake transcriptional regulator
MQSISNKQSQKQAKSSRTALRKWGKRLTSQRALILEIIQQGRGHLDADEIYRRARAVQPRLSLSTVYRTLRVFKEPGLIEELRFDDTHHHYEIKSTRKHHHMVCLGCGKVIEFRYPLARYLKRSVPEVKDFEIVDAELRLSGYCSQCRQKKG